MTCSHTEWVYPPPRQDEFSGEWISTMEQAYERNTYEDIDIGRFRCTQCGEVGYYTGHWREFFEKGTPCFGSSRVQYWKDQKEATLSPAPVAKVVDLEVDATRTLLTTLHTQLEVLAKNKFSGVHCMTSTTQQPNVYRVHKMSIIPRIVESATISTTIQTVVDNLNNTDEYRDSFEWDAPSLWLTITK
jgi:predicted  nucleic acid-binding Zn-ribbon protein